MSGDYQRLADRLEEIARGGVGTTQFTFAELDSIIGGLPASARTHRPWWANSKRGQALAWLNVGWRVDMVDLANERVRFIRDAVSGRRAAERSVAALSVGVGVESTAIVLIGCVKSKRRVPAPAADLYTSPLFARRRAYAEAFGGPWFIISSQWALLDPRQVIAPYDMHLPDQPPSYRRAWGAFVVEQLSLAVPLRSGMTIEVHAGTEVY